MEGGKVYLALLNGLSKRMFFGEVSMNNDYLKSELCPDLADESMFDIV